MTSQSKLKKKFLYIAAPGKSFLEGKINVQVSFPKLVEMSDFRLLKVIHTSC